MDLVLPPYGVVDLQPRGASRPQAEFHRLAGDHTYTMFRGGLGSGKSWAGAWELVTSILENREAAQARGQSHCELIYLVGAPTYQLIDAGPWRHVLNILDEMAILNGFSLIRGKPHKTHPRQINLITGDTINFISTDSGRYAGANAAGFWFDESEESESPEAGFALLDNRLRDRRAARLFGIVTSTPPRSGGGCTAMFESKIAAKDRRYALVGASTKSNPAFADGDYYDRRAGTMSERERLLLLEGQPQPPENTVYGLEFSPHQSIQHDWMWHGGPRKDRKYYLAIDWGGHYWCGLIETEERKGHPMGDRDVVFAEVIRDRVQDEEFLDAVVAECERWGIRRDHIDGVYCDYNPVSAARLAFSPRYWKGKVHPKRVPDRQAKKDGEDTLRWRLRPAQGPRLLTFAPGLRTTTERRGVLASLGQYERIARVIDGIEVTLDTANQDSVYSHACDGLRYYTWQRYAHLRWWAQAPAQKPQ